MSHAKRWFVLDFANLNLSNRDEVDRFVYRWKKLILQYDLNNYLSLMLKIIVQHESYIEDRHPLDSGDYWVKELINYASVFKPIQLELKGFIEDFELAKKWNQEHKEKKEKSEGNFVISLAPYKIGVHRIEELKRKFENIHFTVDTHIDKDWNFYQVIRPDFSTFENCLYYDLMEYMMATNNMILRCEYCNQYITNPTRHQLANVKKKYPIALHEECREDYKLEKDRKRKRKSITMGG